MKKWLLKALWVTLGMAVLLVLLAWGGRAGLRYYGVSKILDVEGARERAEIAPGKKKLETPAGSLVNLGYARFQVAGKVVSVKIASEDGTVLDVESPDFHILFQRPTPPSKMSDENRGFVEQKAAKYPKWAAYMQGMVADEVGSNIGMEETRPATFFDLSLMSADEFLVYSSKLEAKATQKYGRDETFSFESAAVKGTAQIGTSSGDRLQGVMLLASRDGWKFVGCKVIVKNETAGDAGRVIEQIAASFKFTIDDIADTEEIKRMIAGAGIKERVKPGMGELPKK